MNTIEYSIQAWIHGGLGGTCPPRPIKKMALTNRPKITVPPPYQCVCPLDYPFWIRPLYTYNTVYPSPLPHPNDVDHAFSIGLRMAV